MLDFLTPQDQVTLKYFGGEGVVEVDEKNTVWYVNHEGQREETINNPDIVEKYVTDGRLIEI